MEILFETRDEDQRAYLAANPPLSFWAYQAILIGFFLVYAGPAILPFFLSRQWMAGNIFLAIYGFFWLWVMYAARQRKPRVPPEGTLIRIRIEPEGIAELEPKASTWIAWQLIESVTSTPWAVRLLLKSNGNILIPTRVFASEEARDQFVQQAQQYLDACQQDPSGKFPAADDPYLPSWTTGLAQSIDYQNDADQLAFVANSGITPGKRSNIYVSTIVTSLFLSGSIAVMAIGMIALMSQDLLVRDMSSDLKILMCGASAAWFISSLVGTSTLFRWIHRFKMPAYLLTPRRLTLTSQGYILRSSFATLCGAWGNLSRVEQNDEFLALKNLDEQLICVVPKKAFDNPHAAKEFADEAVLTWEEAQKQDEAELNDDLIQAEVVDGDNPFRSPHA